MDSHYFSRSYQSHHNLTWQQHQFYFHYILNSGYLTGLNILCKYINKVVIIIQTFHVIHCKILPHLEIWSMQIIVNRKSIPRVIPSIIPCKPNSIYPFHKTWKAPITEVVKFHWNIISMEAYLFKYINEVWFSLEKKKKCADTRFWNCIVRYKFKNIVLFWQYYSVI